MSALIPGLKAGDAAATARAWERYYGPLVRVASARMNPALARAGGPEDVAQDVILKFFRLVAEPDAEGRALRLQHRGHLWGLLRCMTARAAYDHNKKQDRRAAVVGGESGVGPAGLAAYATSDVPPELEAELLELLTLLDDPRSPERGDVLRTVAVMKLEGYEHAEIAGRLKCSVKSVERKVKLIQRKLDTHRPARRGQPGAVARNDRPAGEDGPP